eukprot:6184926-Pleurochrysis_carterae.AAC.3
MPYLGLLVLVPCSSQSLHAFPDTGTSVGALVLLRFRSQVPSRVNSMPTTQDVGGREGGEDSLQAAAALVAEVGRQAHRQGFAQSPAVKDL